jgi:negative regulator of flagellin synthesis FlgM
MEINKMRIDSSQPTQNTGDAEQIKRTPQDKTQAAATAKTAATDSARISPQSLALQKHLQTIKAQPEVRQDRVDAIKQAMANGTYSVSNQQLGAKMFNDLLKRQG